MLATREVDGSLLVGVVLEEPLRWVVSCGADGFENKVRDVCFARNAFDMKGRGREDEFVQLGVVSGALGEGYVSWTGAGVVLSSGRIERD